MKLRDLFVSIGFQVDDEKLKQLDKGLAQTKRLIMGVGAVATAATGLLVGLAQQVAGVGDQAAKTADKLGIEVEALQELRYAAELSGIAQTNFDTGLQRLTRRAAEAATGTGVAKDALKELGVTLKDGNGNVRKSTDLLADIADGMARIHDPSRRVALAFKLFDTEGVGMVNMLRNGGAALREMRRESRSLGFVISEADARNAEKFNDEWTRLKLLLVGVKNEIGVALLPVFTEWMERFELWIKENREAVLNLDNLARYMRIAGAAAGVFLGIYSASAIGNMLAGIGALTKAIKALGTAGLIANAKVAAIPILIAAAVMAVILLLQDLYTYFTGGKSITGVLIDAFENKFPKSFAVVAFYIGHLQKLFVGLKDFAVATIDYIQAVFSLDFERMAQAAKKMFHSFDPLIEHWKTLFGKAIDWISKKLKPVFDMFEAITNFIKESLESGTKELGGLLESGTKGLGNMIQGAFNLVGLGPDSAPASSGAVNNRQQINNVNAKIDVSVPPGTPASMVGEQVRKGMSDGLYRMLMDASGMLEPATSE